MLRREPAWIVGDYSTPCVPDEVPIFIMEDHSGKYPLASEIIQSTDLLQQSTCYVFISHSHRDIAKVRIIRNYLEEHDFEPILFYLRCMDNKNEDTEKLRELIYKEIDSREWFLYLDSINSRSSDWVKTEIEYIAKSTNHVVKKLCIDYLSEHEIIESIDNLIRNLSVFISCSHKDSELANLFYEELCNYGLKVFLDMKELSPGQSWALQVDHGLVNASQNGGIIFLMTKNSLQSEYVQFELRKAISLNGRVYPIYLDDNIAEDVSSEGNGLLLQNIQWIKCQPTVESIHTCVLKIVKEIRNRIVQ